MPRIISTPDDDAGEGFGPDPKPESEPDKVQLTTLDGFRSRKSGPFGCIVIYDRVRDAPIAHALDCPFVTEEGFVEKVLDGGGHNGRYWWTKNSRVAADQLGARRCRHPGDRLAK